MTLIIGRVQSFDDVQRILDQIKRELEVVQGVAADSGPIATQLTDGEVRVDHDSSGDPVALTLAGHGSASFPHAGHARLVSGKVPTSELGTGTADSTTFLRGDQQFVTLVSGGSGPQGPQGIPGVGIPGMDGKPGSAGFPGTAGAQGPPGAAGAPGAPGVGTLNITQILPAWGGPPGRDSMIPGPQGLPGAAGATGPAGVSGLGLGMLVHEGKPGPWGFPGPPALGAFGGSWNPFPARLSADNTAIAAAAPTTALAVAGLQQQVNVNEEWDVEWILHLANSIAADVFVFNVVPSAGTFTGRVTVLGVSGVPTAGAGVVKLLEGPAGTITTATANAPGNTGTIGLITTVIVRAQGKQTVAAGLLTVQVRAGTNAAASSGTVVVKAQSQMIATRLA